jgi:ADP-ribose pyrophosphatase YjhB (NUDIX family)
VVDDRPLFQVEMQWGAQPVRLTALRCCQLPADQPTTSVHIVALHGGKVLVVCDRKGVFGFPGGRLEANETHDQALCREVYEEACAHLNMDYTLFAVLKIECTTRLSGRHYPFPHTYMAMYAGTVRSLDPIRRDPAGIITSRDLFSREDCARSLLIHDKIMLHEGLTVLATRPAGRRAVRSFLRCEEPELCAELLRLKES